jgi:hypothetical protein
MSNEQEDYATLIYQGKAAAAAAALATKKKDASDASATSTRLV